MSKTEPDVAFTDAPDSAVPLVERTEAEGDACDVHAATDTR